MEDIESYLAGHPFFKDVDGWELQKLAKDARYRKFAAGEYLTREGQKADTFFIVVKGKIRVISDKLTSPDYQEPAPTAIQILKAGEMLGWSWLVPPYEWRFDALASENSEVIALNGKGLREHCETDPKLGYELLKRLATTITDRLAATRMQLAMHSGRPFSQAEGG